MSKATTNSWSSRPNEYAVFVSMPVKRRATAMWSRMIRMRSSGARPYHSRFFHIG